MPNTSKPSSSGTNAAGSGERTDGFPQPSAGGGWLKVGAIAAASATLGGLAAAWFYRKTLSQLREAEHHMPDSQSTSDGMEEDF